MGDDLKIHGVSVNLTSALFGVSKVGTAINGKCGSLTNGHWAVFSGSSDLAIVRKALLARVKVRELPWDKAFSMQPGESKKTYESETDIKAHTWDLYYGKRFALAEDSLVLSGDGSMAMLVGYLPVTWVGDNLYRTARKEMDTPYETHVDPAYYFAFRKLGFSFLVGPSTQKTKKDFAGKDYVEVIPSLTLLVRENEESALEVRGCLMGMRE